MRKLLIFLLLSLLLHLPILLLTVHEAEQGKAPEQIIPIEIIPKEVPQTPEIPLPEAPVPEPPPPPAPKPVAPPPAPIPPAPEPETPLPTALLPEPNPDGQEIGGEELPVTELPSDRPLITPQQVSPDNPPPPMTPEEFLRIPRDRESYGPDRSIRDIIKDYLSQQQLPPGEDSVTFNKMSAKYDSYFYKFARALYGIWQYPPDAARRGEAGIVRVTFNINKDGSVTDINLLESSGYPALDREAMRTLRAMPNLELPDAYELNVLRVNGYFIYTLTGEYRLY